MNSNSSNSKPEYLLNTQNSSNYQQSHQRSSSPINITVTTSHNDLTSAIFNKANIFFVIWFLAIYLIAYLLIGFFFKKTTEPSTPSLFISRSIDFIILFLLLIFLIIFYAYNSESNRERAFQGLTNGLYNFLKNPLSIVSIIFFLLLFYTVVYLFRIPMTTDTKPASIYLVETIAWILFTIIIFVDFFKYIMNISLADILSDFFSIDIIPSGNFNPPTKT